MSKDIDKQHEQEVDLVPVFVWIGNGLKNVFYAIVSLLKAILHFLILFLIFIKKNIILLVVMAILGYFLGRKVW